MGKTTLQYLGIYNMHLCIYEKNVVLKHKEAITIKVRRMATNGSSCAWDGATEQLWHG